MERLSDWRRARGKVYALAALLVLVMTGLLCGQKGPTAIAQWGAELPFLVRAAIGLPLGRRPSAMMLCRLLWHLGTDELEAALRAWTAEVNRQLARHGDSHRLAVDGKAQRRAAKRGATAAYASRVYYPVYWRTLAVAAEPAKLRTTPACSTI